MVLIRLCFYTGAPQNTRRKAISELKGGRGKSFNERKITLI